MLLLVGHATLPDKIKVITSQAGDIDTHVSYVDYDVGTPPIVQAMNNEQHTITTATTTDICAGVANASRKRNLKTVHIRNTHATVTNDVTVVLDAIDGNDYEIWKATLKPGEQLSYVEGAGWWQAAAATPSPLGTNFATASSAAGFATDTYVVGSAIPLTGIGAVRVGRIYRWRLVISKTAAGTVQPTLIARVGTAGSVADTARLTFVFGAGTAAIDRGEFEVEALVTAIGATGVLRGQVSLSTNLASGTGLARDHSVQVTSGTFDMTIANSLIGLSYNGGTSAVHTIEYVTAEQEDL
jgi:hypothetical protein